MWVTFVHSNKKSKKLTLAVHTQNARIFLTFWNLESGNQTGRNRVFGIQHVSKPFLPQTKQCVGNLFTWSVAQPVSPRNYSNYPHWHWIWYILRNLFKLKHFASYTHRSRTANIVTGNYIDRTNISYCHPRYKVGLTSAYTTARRVKNQKSTTGNKDTMKKTSR